MNLCVLQVMNKMSQTIKESKLVWGYLCLKVTKDFQKKDIEENV